jgi:hypothetical protein
MIKVNKKINLAQLDKEFNGFGLICSYDENGVMTEVGLADNNDGSLKDLENCIKSHIAKDPAPLTIEQKLEKAGLSLSELRLALGL